jgi:hypothetical protein
LLNPPKQDQNSIGLNLLGLSVVAVAGVVVFLPFAANTSAWDAVTFRVPGDQGNWWHFLVGGPFFLVFPMIWVWLRSFSALQLSPLERRSIWFAVALAACATTAVAVPVLLRLGNLAGMSAERQLSLLGPTLGILVATGALLLTRRRSLSPVNACILGLDGAYLANAGLCLVVYVPMHESGWVATLFVALFMVLEIAWILAMGFRTTASAKPEAGSEFDPLGTT